MCARPSLQLLLLSMVLMVQFRVTVVLAQQEGKQFFGVSDFVKMCVVCMKCDHFAKNYLTKMTKVISKLVTSKIDFIRNNTFFSVSIKIAFDNKCLLRKNHQMKKSVSAVQSCFD